MLLIRSVELDELTCQVRLYTTNVTLETIEAAEQLVVIGCPDECSARQRKPSRWTSRALSMAVHSRFIVSLRSPVRPDAGGDSGRSVTAAAGTTQYCTYSGQRQQKAHPWCHDSTGFVPFPREFRTRPRDVHPLDDSASLCVYNHPAPVHWRHEYQQMTFYTA